MKLARLTPKVQTANLSIAPQVEVDMNYGHGRGGRPWRRLRARVLRRDGYQCRCEECAASGRVRPAHEVDHIVPLSQGGTDDETNLRAINRDCHRAKTRSEQRGVEHARGTRS